MTTLVIPDVLTGDESVSAEKIDGNFAAIRKFINGDPSTGDGIDSNNLSDTAKFDNSQVAEHNSISSISFNLMNQWAEENVATDSDKYISFVTPEAMTVHGGSITLIKGSSTSVDANFQLFSGLDPVAECFYDNGKGYGRLSLQQPVTFAAGATVGILADYQASSAIIACVITLFVTYEHTGY